MLTNPYSGRAVVRVGIMMSVAIAVGGCVASPQQGGGVSDGSRPQPRNATYACEAGGSLRVESTRGAVRLTDPSGEVYELPAAPPNQTSRFGRDGMALVVEGGEALWMHAGKQPLTCRR